MRRFWRIRWNDGLGGWPIKRFRLERKRLVNNRDLDSRGEQETMLEQTGWQALPLIVAEVAQSARAAKWHFSVTENLDALEPRIQESVLTAGIEAEGPAESNYAGRSCSVVHEQALDPRVVKSVLIAKLYDRRG